MSFTANLRRVIDVADFNVSDCNGYDIEIAHFEREPMRLELANDSIVRLYDQEVTVDDEGYCVAKDENGNDVNFFFQVARPITKEDHVE